MPTDPGNLPWVLSPGPGSGQALDDLDDLLAAESVVPCEFEEFPGAGEHGAALGGAGHGDAAAAAELQEPFLPELVQRTEHGVLVHAQHGGEVLGQGQALAGGRLALGDGPADLAGDLIVQ